MRLQGRSKSLTHIDTLDPGMLVSRESSGDCRSEPDTSAPMAGSQDRLSVPAGSPAANGPVLSPTSSAATLTPTLASSASTPNSLEVASPGDPAARRRRLSNLYKVRVALYFAFILPLFCRPPALTSLPFFSICPSGVPRAPDNKLRVFQREFRLLRRPRPGGVCRRVERDEPSVNDRFVYFSLHFLSIGDASP